MGKQIRCKNSYFEVLDETDTHYMCCPVGGGQGYTIPKEDAEECEVKSDWKPVRTSVCRGRIISAFADLNRRWNGWLDPFFEKDVILGYLKKEGYSVIDTKSDSITFTHDVMEGQPVALDRYEIDGKELWNISGWCWELEEDSCIAGSN